MQTEMRTPARPLFGALALAVGLTPSAGAATFLLDNFDGAASAGANQGVTFTSSTAVFGPAHGIQYGAPLFPAQGTMEVVVKVNAVGSDLAAGGVILDSAGAQGRVAGDVFLYVTPAGIVRFTLSTGGFNPTAEVQVSSTRPILADGKFHSIAVSYGSSGVKLYLDGSLQATHPLSAPRAARPVSLGDFQETLTTDYAFSFTGEVEAIRTSTTQDDLGLAVSHGCLVEPVGDRLSRWPASGHPDDLAGPNPGFLRCEGSACELPSYAPGMAGQAFSLDGLDDYVEVADSASLDAITTASSVSAWVRPDAAGAVFSRRTPLVSEGFSIEVRSDAALSIIVKTTLGLSAFRTNPGTVTLGEFSHVAVTASTLTGSVKGYVNGQPLPLTLVSGPATIGGSLVNADSLFIGRRQGAATVEGIASARYFRGLIDELELHARDLSAHEIQATFDSARREEVKLVADGLNPSSVAIDGDTISVGTWGEEGVFVFVREGGVWTQQARLVPNEPGWATGTSHFGRQVALEGDTLVTSGGSTENGAVYLFQRNGTSWTQQAKLTASAGADSDAFGLSLAVAGDKVVVGAYQSGSTESSPPNGPGAAYVFVRPANGWADKTEDAKLVANDGAPDDSFGVAIDIEGAVIAIGAFNNDAVAPNAGAAYVFEWTGTAWVQTAKLTASDGVSLGILGYPITIDADTILVGAQGDPGYGPAFAKGAAYVFVRPSGGWTDKTEDAKLIANDRAVYDVFGGGVSLSSAIGAVSAYYDDDACSGNPDCNSGSAYVFVRRGSCWNQRAKLTASDAGPGRLFGIPFAGAGATIVAGDRSTEASNKGAIYVFNVGSTTLEGQAVVVQPEDLNTGESPVTVTFQEVTSAGSTSVTTSNDGPSPPSGFQLCGTYFDLKTSATLAAGSDIQVCIDTSGLACGASPTLHHFEDTNGDGAADAWVALVTGGSPPLVCGTVTSLSPFAIFTPGNVTVAIDIKPGSYPNSVNPSKKGVVPVAVLGRPLFDAATVNPGSACFGDAESPSERDCTLARGTVVKDVNGDGTLDLVLHFEAPQTGIDPGDTQACLSARLFDGTPVSGCDSVKTK